MEQIICNPAARAPWSKGKIVGPKVAIQSERDLGHSSTPAASQTVP